MLAHCILNPDCSGLDSLSKISQNQPNDYEATVADKKLKLKKLMLEIRQISPTQNPSGKKPLENKLYNTSIVCY